jgi:acyl dehydratase
MQPPLSFDDVKQGDVWHSPTRTITETDVVNFAGMTGDFNPLHVDHEFARNTPFGKPIAHGLLGLSFVAGLGCFSPWMQTAAFMRIVEWKFLKPLYIGDTVRVRTEVMAKTGKGRRHGQITWQRSLINQMGEVVQEGTFETLVKAGAQTDSLRLHTDEPPQARAA